jgi:glycerophosphoryl diester phosphodiesterase
MVIAHRGASGRAPETTLEAYRLAIETGCDGVEADVQMLGDGTLVAFHDPDVGRTTDGAGTLAEHTLESIKRLDAGSWFNRAFPEKARREYAGLRVPTLQELLDLLRESPQELFLEIKSPELHPPEFESLLLDALRVNRFEGRTRMMSFSAASLAKVKSLRPGMRTSLLAHRAAPSLADAALEAGADELGVLHELAAPELVDAAHRRGLVFSVWTVDEPEDVRRMLALGVDCITSNHPERVLAALA